MNCKHATICRYVDASKPVCNLAPICRFCAVGSPAEVVTGSWMVTSQPSGPEPVVALLTHDAAQKLGVVKGRAKKGKTAPAPKPKGSAKEGRAPKYAVLDPRKDEHLTYAFKALNRWAREERLNAAAQTELAYLRGECPLGAKYLIDSDRKRLVELYAAQRKAIVEAANKEAA